MKRTVLLLVLLMAAGTASAQLPSPSQPPTPPPMPTPRGEVLYSCPGGMDFASTFSNDGELATLRMPGQPDIELSRAPSGSGFVACHAPRNSWLAGRASNQRETMAKVMPAGILSRGLARLRPCQR